MNQRITVIGLITGLLLSFPFTITAQQDLYTKTGTDYTWEYIEDNNLIPIGQTSNTGIKGSTIDVNNNHPEITGGLYGKNPFDRNIRIHTLGNSGIQPNDFPKWSRWYQEDGNTQIFRMFKGEYNTRNDRKNSARIEAFSNFQYDRGDGWQEWTGRYTIVEPIFAAIMQVKDTGAGWASVIKMDYDGSIVYTQPGKKNITLGRNMKGKSFDLRIRDDGFETEVYYNGTFIGKHNDGARKKTQLRWGMYVHSNHVARSDGMIFITGARVNGEPVNNTNKPPTVSFSEPISNITLEEGYDQLYVLAEGSDPDNDPISVKLYIDGEEKREEKSAPYEWGHISADGSDFSEETKGLTIGMHELKVVVTDSWGGSSEATMTIEVKEGTLSVGEFEQNNLLKLYPNPAENEITVQFLTNEQRWIRILDMTGKEIHTKAVSAKINNIDISNLSAGMYLLSVKDDKGSQTNKTLLFSKY